MEDSKVSKRWIVMAQEVNKILEHIQANHYFLLNGGAGSGKTHTLVEVIREVGQRFPSKSIACITYTNAAALEIEHRVNNENLRVSTIHDFLWDCIKNYQRDLKKSLVNLLNESNSLKSPNESSSTFPDNYFESQEKPISIEYREYQKLKDGIISHDDVLSVAKDMFARSKRLVDIVKSRFPLIFIDEYQDTQSDVIDIFINSFKKTDKQCVIGFFGDSMQSIYENGIGDLNDYLYSATNPDRPIYEVRKEDNYRNPLSVIRIANQLRLDGLQQKATNGITLKNGISCGINEGSAVFYYSENEEGLKKLYESLESQGWNFKDFKQTKELRLTHNLIAKEAGFPTLYDIHAGDKILEYVKRVRTAIPKVLGLTEDKFFDFTFDQTLNKFDEEKPGDQNWKPTQGQQEYISNHQSYFDLAKSLKFDSLLKCYVSKNDIIDDNHDEVEGGRHTATISTQSVLIKHLNKIEKCIRLYESKNYNEFVKCSSFKSIVRFSQKKELKEAIEKMTSDPKFTIGEVIQLADKLKICVKDDALNHYEERYYYVYKRVCEVSYLEFRKLFQYNALLNPFSTQHKTKGLEFNNVLVILDNGKWNKYNFSSLFTNEHSNKNVLDRTKKLFYVCCTRTKDNLAVYFPNPKSPVVEGAKAMFGESNVIKL